MGRAVTEGGVASPAAPEQQARERTRRFGRLLLGWFAGVALVNWLVNPWGIYAPRLVDPRTADIAQRKRGLLRRCRPAPEQLVLGASTMMCVEPRLLERRTGLRTFNAAIAGGGLRAGEQLYRYAAGELRAPVRSVLVGICPVTVFRKDTSAGTRLSNAARPDAERAGHDTPGVTPEASVLPLLFSWQQAKDAGAALYYHFNPQRKQRRWWVSLAADGGQRWSADDERRRRPGWSVPGAVREQLARTSLARPGTLDPGILADLGAFLAQMRVQKVEAVVCATPVAEELRRVWRENGFERQERDAIARMAAIAARHGARFADLSTAAAFGGDPGEFYDAIHPTRVNTARMIERLYPETAAHVVQ